MNDVIEGELLHLRGDENLAETLARVLPESRHVPLPAAEAFNLHHIAVPAGHKVHRLDLEKVMAHPRFTEATARLSDADSFCAYVTKHQEPRTVVWCFFDPQTYKLSFTAVIDEHAPAIPGWRKHQAQYTPDMSAEWKVWSKLDKQAQAQADFAAFLERHELDVATQDGYPTSAQMLQMATEFELHSEKKLKSAVRLMNGGVQLQYVEDEDAGTVAQMKAFDRFQIGIPVFWSGPAYRIDARLRYRQQQAKVAFWYELIRPDVVHEAAAKELIVRVRQGIGGVPLLMGECK